MIYQISPIQAKTQSISHLNKGLIQVRHIQARIKENSHSVSSARNASVEGAHLLPANIWFD